MSEKPGEKVQARTFIVMVIAIVLILFASSFLAQFGTGSQSSTSGTTLGITSTTRTTSASTLGLGSTLTTYSNSLLPCFLTGCPCVAATTNETAITAQFLLPFLRYVSAMKVSFNSTLIGDYGSAVENTTSSYVLIYADTSSGITTYKIGISYLQLPSNGSASSPEDAVAWVKSDGTVLAVEHAGQNESGPSAGQDLLGIIGPFAEESTLMREIGLYTSSYFHSIGNSSVTLGTTSMQVTTYAAESLPMSVDVCGDLGTLNSFSLQVGTLPSTDLNLVTFLHLSVTSGALAGTLDNTIQISSITEG